MRNLRLIFFAGFLVSTFILSVKILQPVSIQLKVNGSTIELTQQPPFYGLLDVFIMTGAAFTAGASIVCLVTGIGEVSRIEASSAKLDLMGILERVENEDEKEVLKLIVESGGSVFQSDLTDRSGFSKGKVSLLLDRLEARGIVQRKRSGMTNLVFIK